MTLLCTEAVAVFKEIRVIGYNPFRLANTTNRTVIPESLILFKSLLNNQELAKVCGKAVNRGGGLGVEIQCVFTFLMVLGNT